MMTAQELLAQNNIKLSNYAPGRYFTVCPACEARNRDGAQVAPAPSSLQNIRLRADGANPLSRSRNWRADSDGCDGLHIAAASSRV
jgi:hypothetical protein